MRRAARAQPLLKSRSRIEGKFERDRVRRSSIRVPAECRHRARANAARHFRTAKPQRRLRMRSRSAARERRVTVCSSAGTALGIAAGVVFHCHGGNSRRRITRQFYNTSIPGASQRSAYLAHSSVSLETCHSARFQRHHSVTGMTAVSPYQTSCGCHCACASMVRKRGEPQLTRSPRSCAFAYAPAALAANS